jgi:hypothetical protein
VESIGDGQERKHDAKSHFEIPTNAGNLPEEARKILDGGSSAAGDCVHDRERDIVLVLAK